jgi:hypothetical protein
VPHRETQTALGSWSGGTCCKAGVYKLDSSQPKPGRMEESLEGGRGPPRTVVPLERERERERETERDTQILLLDDPSEYYPPI